MAKPPPSDWGKLSAGQAYVPWAVDVARAVFALGLGENVGALFWYVVERSWGGSKLRRDGWPDPVPVQICYAEIATLWGVKYQRIYDAKKWLVRAQMFIENDKGLWVNKNAHKWVNPETGAPLLSPERLTFALAGRTRTHKPDQDTPSNVPTLDSNVTTLDEGAASNVTTLDFSRYNVRSHIEERARGKKEKEKEAAEQKAPPPVASQDRRREDSPEPCPPYPDDANFPLDVTPGNYHPTRQESERVWSILWDHFNTHASSGARRRLLNEFYQAQRLHAHETWLEAIREVYRRGMTEIGSIDYIRRIAGDIEVGRFKPRKPKHPAPLPEALAPVKKPVEFVAVPPGWRDHVKGTK